MKTLARLSVVLLLVLAAGGCGLNPKQQTQLASDGSEVLIRDFDDRYEHQQVTNREFADAESEWKGPMKAAVNAMWAHVDDVGATLATSPWWAAFRDFTAAYAKGQGVKQQADRRPAKPPKLPAVTPGAQPPDAPATAGPPLAPLPGG